MNSYVASDTFISSDESGFDGCRPGRYTTGDVFVDVLHDGCIVVDWQIQFLASAGATIGECLVYLMNICGVTLAESWPLASNQPAAMMKRAVAGLQEGSPAHFIVFRMTPIATSGGRGLVSDPLEYPVAGGVVYR